MVGTERISFHKDSEGNDTTKKIKMMLDDETIITTYFDEEISDGIIELSLGTTSSTSELESYYKQAQNIAVFLNTDPMPITYKIDVNRFVYSDITEYEIKIMTITFAVIAVLAGVAMIVRFKKNGVMGAFTSLGFIALLLLAVRLGNVELTLAGIFAIAVSYIIEYFILWSVLKEYSKGQNCNCLSSSNNSCCCICFDKLARNFKCWNDFILGRVNNGYI